MKVSYPSPQRVELEANLEFAGIVVLADIHYPGWKLTIDGQTAPIYKVNRLMAGRGSRVSTGWFTATNHARSRSAARSRSRASRQPRALPSTAVCGRVPDGRPRADAADPTSPWLLPGCW